MINRSWVEIYFEYRGLRNGEDAAHMGREGFLPNWMEEKRAFLEEGLRRIKDGLSDII